MRKRVRQLPDSLWTSHALCAAYLLPSKRETSALRKVMDAWIEDCRPVAAAEDFAEIIRGEKGTILEPFAVDERHMALATAFCRLATSERIGYSRTRIVPAGAAQSSGGLVITRQLRSFFAECFAFAKNPRAIETQPCLNLGCIPEPYEKVCPIMSRWTSLLSFEEKSATVRMPLQQARAVAAAAAPKPAKAVELQSEVQTGIEIGGSDRSIDQYGLRVELETDDVVIRTGDPSSLIRFNGLLAARATVRFQGRHGDTMVVLLRPPEDDSSTPLETIYFPSRTSLSWLAFPCRETPPLDSKLTDYLLSLFQSAVPEN
jgi:hypothetical protein